MDIKIFTWLWLSRVGDLFSISSPGPWEDQILWNKLSINDKKDYTHFQVTENIKQILDKDGTFAITARGTINVTLIGEINTYWLIGRKEYREERKLST